MVSGLSAIFFSRLTVTGDGTAGTTMLCSSGAVSISISMDLM